MYENGLTCAINRTHDKNTSTIEHWKKFVFCLDIQLAHDWLDCVPGFSNMMLAFRYVTKFSFINQRGRKKLKTVRILPINKLHKSSLFAYKEFYQLNSRIRLQLQCVFFIFSAVIRKDKERFMLKLKCKLTIKCMDERMNYWIPQVKAYKKHSRHFTTWTSRWTSSPSVQRELGIRKKKGRK